MTPRKSNRGLAQSALPTLGRPREKRVSDYRQLLRRKSDKRVIRPQLDDAWTKLEVIREEIVDFFEDQSSDSGESSFDSSR